MTSLCVDDVTNTLFNEIIPKSIETRNISDTVDVYAIQVQPQDCGRVIKWLSKELPLLMHVSSSSSSSSKSSSCSTSDIIHDLSHLKRVRKKLNKSTIENEVTLLHNNTIADDLLPPIKKVKHSIEPTETLTKDDTIGKTRNYKDETIQVLLHVASWLEEASTKSDVDSIDLCRTNLDDLLEKLTIHFNSSITKNFNIKTDADVKLIDGIKEESSSFIVSKESVPGRNAITGDEWRTFNTIWPIHYFPNQMVEHLKDSQSLTKDEQEQMIMGMKAAINDRYHNTKYNLHGTVIIDPKNGQIISKSYDEYCIQQNLFETTMMQQNDNSNSSSNDVLLCHRNPLVTSIILACQGVSRIERQNAQNHGMNNENFQKGQYICTGYDVYTTFEPTTYEAMALIHSRINRLIFGCSVVSDNLHDFQNKNNYSKPESNCSNRCQPRQSSGIIHSQVHAIPGLNHKYRAFRCKQNSDLWSLCCQSYRNTT